MRLVAVSALALVLVLGCRRAPSPPSPPPPAQAQPLTSATVVPAGDPGPVRLVDLPIPGDLPAYVVRGASAEGRGERAPRTPMLFIPGMCVHPGGYVSSFQHTAASRGDLVTVQGDVSCNDAYGGRRWSSDLVAMDKRVDAAFRAAGLGEPRGVIVLGYSQGAERAEKLVARFPEKYSAAILISSPVVPSAALLSRADAVVLMAGQYDLAQGTHPAAVSSLKRAGIASAFFTLPGARHGQMGETPEDSMKQALDFVEETRRVKLEARAPSRQTMSHEGLPSR